MIHDGDYSSFKNLVKSDPCNNLVLIRQEERLGHVQKRVLFPEKIVLTSKCSHSDILPRKPYLNASELQRIHETFDILASLAFCECFALGKTQNANTSLHNIMGVYIGGARGGGFSPTRFVRYLEDLYIHPY